MEETASVKTKSKDLAILKHVQEPGLLGYRGVIAVLHVEGGKELELENVMEETALDLILTENNVILILVLKRINGVIGVNGLNVVQPVEVGLKTVSEFVKELIVWELIKKNKNVIFLPVQMISVNLVFVMNLQTMVLAGK